MQDLSVIGQKAKSAAESLFMMSAAHKNEILRVAADALEAAAQRIIAENKQDIENAVAAGIKPTLIDRLLLDEKRIAAMAEGLRKIVRLEDPVGTVLFMKTLENGLTVGQKRVPIGVVAIIYEARPNVTSDAFGLCLKSGNSVILRGGKEAIRSNTAIVETIRAAIRSASYNEDIVQIITDTTRETATALMKLNGYVDVLIPRGSAGLIKSVVENSTIPVIETGTGNCHIYVDASADLDMAKNIILNAKTQRPGVCNACEKVLLHKATAPAFLSGLCDALREKGVEVRGDERVLAIEPTVVLAQESDWPEEYLDLIIAIAVVDSLDEAIAHIRRYSSKHSEAIVTRDYANAQRFLNEIDSAAVYVNASTRFTDGEEFGFGAEIGISTQKLHARGPMGLKELTTTKYIIYGDGQVR